MRAQGIDVVSLGAGEPDFDTPDHIKAAAAAALNGGETKYAKPASGVPELKQAVIGKLARENGLTYTPEQVVASVGGKEALYLAFATLLDPGDEVIIPAPYWVSYPEQVKLAGGVPVFVNAGADAGFRITPEQLRNALTPRTRALVFNSPSNPTGAAYSPEETDALADVLADTDVVTFSDEMYDRLLFGGRKFKSFAATSAHAYDHTITFNAGSKTYSMTGWRIGYAAGPVDVIKGMAKLQSQTTSGAATFTMHALAAALERRPSLASKKCAWSSSAAVGSLATASTAWTAWSAPSPAVPSTPSPTSPARSWPRACPARPSGPAACSKTPTSAWCPAATSATTPASASASPPAWPSWKPPWTASKVFSPAKADAERPV